MRYTGGMYYYEVAPKQIVRKGSDFLTYSHPEKLPIGQVVEIPVGKKILIGVIFRTVTRPDFETKEISGLITSAIVPVALLETTKWISSYYMTPLATVLQTVLPRGINKKRRNTSVNAFPQQRDRTNFVFNKIQTAAIKQIDSMQSGTILLHGVTGSGKTRVYIEAAKRTLAQGKSTIVLVPEIALTSQLIAEFQHEFKDILLTHSRQTEAERHSVWLKAGAANTPVVAIGPRSALFLPLAHVGLIVVDEFHEPSYKQEQSPRYSAVLVAKILAKNHAARLILGSATPLVSDYYLAQSTGGTIIEMPTPAISDTPKPKILLVDMTKRANFTKHRFLSDQLLAAIDQTLQAQKQVLIFHNRRGSASVTLCENCGWQAGCPRCFIPLTLHADQHRLVCHICNYSAAVPTSCPECSSVDIIHKGIGTKLIESELIRLFPNAKIARFDGDNAREDTVDKQYQSIYDGSIDIIIGTQVIAKGLDLPHLRTVGIVQADAGLSLPDYASEERTFQLLAQVIGRVGRNQHQASVVVQSYQPNHIAVESGIARNYGAFYDHTIRLRQHSKFPPFRFLLKLVCVYKTEATAVKNSRTLAATIRQNHPDVEILGPTPAFYERMRDTYRWQIVVRSQKRAALQQIVQELPPQGWQFELDPISLL